MYRFLFRVYLRVHQLVYDRVMYHLAPKCFGGSHPKNIFHYRSEFFEENVNSSDVVLDLACGQGMILKRISKKIRTGIGIDQNTRMLAIARNNAPSNLRFLEGDIYKTQATIQAEGVTKIVLSHILEHLSDPVAFLRTLEGKELLICVPSEENWYRQLLKHMKLPYLSDPTHFREYTRALLKEHLAGAGYLAIFSGFNSEGEIICRATK